MILLTAFSPASIPREPVGEVRPVQPPSWWRKWLPRRRPARVHVKRSLLEFMRE